MAGMGVLRFAGIRDEGTYFGKLNSLALYFASIFTTGFSLFRAGFIKVCSVATPSSNPNKPKAKTMSLRRRPRNNPGYVGNEPPPPYDIEMGAHGGHQGRNQGRNAR